MAEYDMGFWTGLLTGMLLSPESNAPRKEHLWEPERGTVHSRGYLGVGRDFPVQVLISGSASSVGQDGAKVLVKWISFAGSPDQFASAAWNWMTIKKIDGALHFIEE